MPLPVDELLEQQLAAHQVSDARFGALREQFDCAATVMSKFRLLEAALLRWQTVTQSEVASVKLGASTGLHMNLPPRDPTRAITNLAPPWNAPHLDYLTT